MKKKTCVLFLIICSPYVILPSYGSLQSWRKKNQSSQMVSSTTEESPVVAFRKRRRERKALAAREALPRKRKKTDSSKKRILIFSSKGGGGHTAVSKGLTEYLEDDYEIAVVNIFQDVIPSIDTLSILSFGRFTGEDLYNFCLLSRWTNVLNMYAEVGVAMFERRQHAVEKILFDYFKYEKPDLLISVVPFVNGALFSVTKKLNIPFLVVTNDIDTSNYVVGIKDPDYKKFKYTLPFEDDSVREKIKGANIPEKQIEVTGFPLRPEFGKAKKNLGAKELAAIKKEFNVPEGKPVVMLFMGATGSLTSYRFVRILAKMNMPMHILVCLGRNERLRRSIKKIILPKCVTMSIIGFTDRMSDLMSISNVVITKPGPGSSCEALESSVPMIHDQTQGTLAWEQLSVNFMAKHGFAEPLKNFQDLPTILPKYIKDNTHADSVKKKMKAFKREYFEDNVKGLVDSMFTL